MTKFQIECAESRMENNCDQYGRFIIQPLKKSHSITVGNALRRILLSEIEGTAITAARIAGVSHEFCGIPGIREDVLEIILNLKHIILKNYSQEPQIGRLRIQGPARVTAANFELPSDVEIIDPTQYIATVCTDTTLEMEFRIEKGKGYNILDKEQVKKNIIDFLPIDAVFMPIRKVNYMTEELYIDQIWVQDRLILEIWTNGSVSPLEALHQGADILCNLFNNLRSNPSIDTTDKIINSHINETEDKITQIPIEELQLSVRAYNCLKRAQMHFVSDLLESSQEDLLEIRNFGQKSAKEVIEALQTKFGIILPKKRISKNS
uniref:DNA-directed RNA polymerase subunit alpha n=1 Tax=Glaucocystis incrassata TaxID=1789788 RepID=A0A3G1IVP2_9EUKA|nr:RNA polymerase alpha subunit [Glaucocystis incrassata]ASQ40115.1 RNA polymerase alpha subunit [Glaucocystis incrassata]